MAENKSLVAVVIPVYQANLSDAEQMSLQQCMNVLGNYPVIIVKPAGLDITAFKQEYPLLTFQSFDNSFFTGVDSYNLYCLRVHPHLPARRIRFP